MFATGVGAEPLVGRASVIDGDTLDLHGTRIRLHGVDAPESNQDCEHPIRGSWRCGQKASLALDDFIAMRPVQCLQRDKDQYGRVVAECFVAGESVNAWLVRSGWAVAYRQYSKQYVPLEALAQRDAINIWSGRFQQPAQFRRTGGSPPQAAPASCVIKGNINAKGGRIFHQPGQQDYDRTRIDTTKGERWFCSAAEALGAGWRAAGR